MLEKVGDIYFAPGFTSYRNQLQYQTYDVTAQLQQENELIAVVGGGWAVGSFTYKRVNRNYVDRQALLCELRITYEDGTEEIISTRSKVFQKLDMDLDELPLPELLKLVQENPGLLRRPIMIDEKRLQVGFNEDEIRRFLPREVRALELRHAQLMAGL